MHYQTYARLLLLLTGTLFSAGLQAQEANISATFRIIGWDRIRPTPPLHYSPSQTKPISSISGTRRSDPIAYQGPNPILFYTEEVGADGIPVRTVRARARIPSGYREPLLIFVPLKKPKTDIHYKVIVVEDSQASFPFGTYRVVNLTGRTIAGAIGEKKVQIEHGQSRLIDPDLKEDGSLGIKFFANNDEDGWDPLFSTVLPHRTTRRSLMFYIPDPDGRAGKFKSRVFNEQQSLFVPKGSQ